MEEKLWYKEGQKDNAVKMYLAGSYSQKDIGDIMGVSTTTVNRHFRENNVKPPKHGAVTIEVIKGLFDSKGYEMVSTKYTGAHDKLKYICPKHKEKGVLEITYGHLMSGRGCKHCWIERMADNKRTPYQEVRRVFEEKGYQLITRDYKNTRQPLEYLCKKHLEKGILTSNYSDMRLGHSCKYCANEERLGTYNTVSANRNKEEWSNTPANIYLIRCSSEDELFYKVGVTTTTANLRFNSSSKMPYDFEVICEAPTNLYQAILLEESILREVKKDRYRPKLHFGGYTECFKHCNQKQIKRMMIK